MYYKKTATITELTKDEVKLLNAGVQCYLVNSMDFLTNVSGISDEQKLESFRRLTSVQLSLMDWQTDKESAFNCLIAVLGNLTLYCNIHERQEQALLNSLSALINFTIDMPDLKSIIQFSINRMENEAVKMLLCEVNQCL